VDYDAHATALDRTSSARCDNGDKIGTDRNLNTSVNRAVRCI